MCAAAAMSLGVVLMMLIATGAIVSGQQSEHGYHYCPQIIEYCALSSLSMPSTSRFVYKSTTISKTMSA